MSSYKLKYKQQNNVHVRKWLHVKDRKFKQEGFQFVKFKKKKKHLKGPNWTSGNPCRLVGKSLMFEEARSFAIHGAERVCKSDSWRGNAEQTRGFANTIGGIVLVVINFPDSSCLLCRDMGSVPMCQGNTLT